MPAQRDPILLTRMKTWRLERDLSLDELSVKSGVSKAQLSDLERGAKGTTARTHNAIATALGVRPSDLI